MTTKYHGSFILRPVSLAYQDLLSIHCTPTYQTQYPDSQKCMNLSHNMKQIFKVSHAGLHSSCQERWSIPLSQMCHAPYHSSAPLLLLQPVHSALCSHPVSLFLPVDSSQKQFRRMMRTRKRTQDTFTRLSHDCIGKRKMVEAGNVLIAFGVQKSARNPECWYVCSKPR